MINTTLLSMDSILNLDPFSGSETTELPLASTTLLDRVMNNTQLWNSSEWEESVWDRYGTMQALMYEFRPAVYYLRIHLPFIWIFLGIPGNILSVIIWTKPRLKSTSGHYLAAGAFFDLINQMLRIFYALNKLTTLTVYDHPGICQISILLFTMCQYNHTILILAFTIERFIAIAYPFQRATFCTRSKALKVIAVLISFSFACSIIQVYFFYCDPEFGCTLRPEVTQGGMKSVFSIWTWVTELFFFVVLPITILVLNIVVITKIRKSKDIKDQTMQYFQAGLMETKKKKPKRPSATTLTLLSLSFYTIVMEIPVTILYCVLVAFPQGDPFLTDEEIRTDDTWQAYLNYYAIRFSIENIAASHYAIGFYISLLTAKKFRQEVWKLYTGSTCHSNDERYLNGTQSMPLDTSVNGEQMHSVRNTPILKR